MIDVETLWGRKINTAARVNSLYVPADSLNFRLLHFTDPGLFFHEEHSDYGLSKSGSFTKVRIGDRFFVMATSHQLETDPIPYDFINVVLHDTEGGHLTTSSSATYQVVGTGERLDIIIFDFTEPVENGSLSSHHWYDLSQEIIEGKDPDFLAAFCFGYPSDTNTIDYETLSYRSSGLVVFGEPTTSSLANRMAIHPKHGVDRPMAGMSGGPVFGVQLNDFSANVVFAGIITNASSKKVNFLPISSISKFLIHALHQ